ncbi:MAG TPA: sigma-70 family RNA polymerase sigma factor [Pyrinomonadaceae bacterium]|nr:sigma-70 family RNA polymerase sigma factor [Pyrinomonadaceae bacterium]
MATQITDSELVQTMLGGDKEAFAELYRRRQRDVYRFALHMTGIPDVAEDVTQEVFIVLMRRGNEYDELKGSVNAFLLGVARNYVLRRLRQDRCFVSIDDAADSAANNEAGVHETFSRTEAILAMQKAVLNLPEHYREAVVLCDLQELTYNEAALVLGCAIGTVRSRLHRARTMLIEKLRTRGDGAPEKELESARCFA